MRVAEAQTPTEHGVRSTSMLRLLGDPEPRYVRLVSLEREENREQRWSLQGTIPTVPGGMLRFEGREGIDNKSV